MSDITIDDLLYLEPAEPQPPLPNIGAPPCDTCEHLPLCTKELLACCAYAAYYDGKPGRRERRKDHRHPSAEWYAHVMHDARAPRCDLCAEAGKPPPFKAEPGKSHNRTRMKIIPVLKDVGEASTTDIAGALGLTRDAVKKSLSLMRKAGLVELIQEPGEAPRWRLK